MLQFAVTGGVLERGMKASHQFILLCPAVSEAYRGYPGGQLAVTQPCQQIFCMGR
jgi:hypothetical protein